MPLTPQPFVEHPNLRVPISLIVDDPAPCINPLWYFRHQVGGQAVPVYPRTIPLSFMDSWCRWVSDSGVRGDFTILPFPAGLGCIDRNLEGCDPEELRAWLRLARVAARSPCSCWTVWRRWLPRGTRSRRAAVRRMTSRARWPAASGSRVCLWNPFWSAAPPALCPRRPRSAHAGRARRGVLANMNPPHRPNKTKRRPSRPCSQSLGSGYNGWAQSLG